MQKYSQIFFIQVYHNFVGIFFIFFPATVKQKENFLNFEFKKFCKNILEILESPPPI